MKLIGLLLLCLSVSFAASLIDSPLRNREPLKVEDIENIVFGVKFFDVDPEAECHVDVDVHWSATVAGGNIPHLPLISDLRNDGQKEIIIAAHNEYVEVIEGQNGEKEPGWPFYLPDRNFVGQPVSYDFIGGSTRDIIVTTVQGELIFLNDEGLPYHGATLKVPNYIIDKKWYLPFIEAEQTPFAPMWETIPDREKRIADWTTTAKLFIKLYNEQAEKARLSDPKDSEELFKLRLAEHVEDQQAKVEGHIRAFNRQRSFGRRLLAKDDDDDLEDERGERFSSLVDKLDGAGQIFTGVHGWLTNDGVESLELFLPTETGNSVLGAIRSSVDPLFSPQLENFKIIMNSDVMLEGEIDLVPSIVSTPVVVDLEGDGHNEIIVAVNYRANSSAHVNHEMYSLDAIVAFDMMLHQVKWISALELSSQHESKFRATIMSKPTFIDLDGDGELNIIVGTMMGHIHVLDNWGCPLKGFPLVMGPIAAPVTVEDIDEDGKLEIIGLDIVSTLAVFSAQGKMIWNVLLSPGCFSAPAIADINNNGDLDLVIASSSGVIHVLDAWGAEIAPFPLLTESSAFKPTPAVVKMKQNAHYHVLTVSGSHLFIVDGITACTEIVDLGENIPAAVVPGIIADDVTGNGMLDLVVSTGFRQVYCLSTDTFYHPLNTWNTNSGSRTNVNTAGTHTGVYILNEYRQLRDITGQQFLIQFEIVDFRNNIKDSYYDVQFKLKREIDPIFSGRFSSPGIKTVYLPAPPVIMSATLRIEMLNEHQQFYTDSVALTFNYNFHLTIKYVIVVPFIICSIFVFYLRQEFEDMIII